MKRIHITTTPSSSPAALATRRLPLTECTAASLCGDDLHIIGFEIIPIYRSNRHSLVAALAIHTLLCVQCVLHLQGRGFFSSLQIFDGELIVLS